MLVWGKARPPPPAIFGANDLTNRRKVTAATNKRHARPAADVLCGEVEAENPQFA